MRVLFLDVDGVLNSRAHTGQGFHPDHPRMFGMAPEHAAVLQRVLEQTGAKVVISSTWRLHFDLPTLEEMLKRVGVSAADVIDRTPSTWGPRGHEIQAWLDEHPEVERFAIVDDDADMEHLLPYLVQTSFDTGLTDEHVAPLVSLLTGAREAA